jgi:hypothetical protein
MSARLQKILSTLFANVGAGWDAFYGGMVPFGASLADAYQRFLHIPLGVPAIFGAGIRMPGGPVLSNLYPD